MKKKMNEIFEKNLQKFARFCPDFAKEVEKTDCTPFIFCSTEKGELNLARKEGDQLVYYHSQKGAVREAQQWMMQFCLTTSRALFIYGIGLGYYYDALKKWLKSNSSHYLLFLEDDPRVLHRFLETEKASEMLSDPQVLIKGFKKPSEHEWGNFRKEFEWLVWAFARIPLLMGSLNLYIEENYLFAKQLFTQIAMNIENKNTLNFFVFEQYPKYIFANFYWNLTYLPEAYFGNELFDLFYDIPAIICGAGPSLEKHFTDLKQLQDKAVIFAAGSAINSLSWHGVEAHFGVGLDPTPSQTSRILSNCAYMTPFFYMASFSHEGLRTHHGEKLFLSSDQFGLVESWFEKKLGVTSKIPFSSGVSSATFCLEIAYALGCKPIILTGLDLAYTSSSRYPEGMYIHPLEDQKEQKNVKGIQEGKIKIKGSDGSDVSTRWAWLKEAGDFSAFAQFYPELPLFNVTEGGVPLIDIPNRKLKEVIETEFVHFYDIGGLVYSAIQSHPITNITHQTVMDVMGEWEASLKKCRSFCDHLIQEFEELNQKVEFEGYLPSFPETSKSLMLLDELHQEVAYLEFLKNINPYFENIMLLENNALKQHEELFSHFQKLLKLIEIELKRFNFFKQHIKLHLSMIEKIKQEQSQQAKDVAVPSVPNIPISYSFANGKLSIIDEEMGIDLQEQFHPLQFDSSLRSKKEKHIGRLFHEENGKLEGQYLFFYPEGELRGESFYKSGLLHGPSTFYSKNGTVLMQTWFWYGKRVGKLFQYFYSGKPASIQRFREGLRHGVQEYYNVNGVLKASLNYADGQLDGHVILYFSNGKKKREFDFSKGKLHGYEKKWNEMGTLLMEAKYEENQPVDRTRIWHPNGQLAKEIVYYGDADQFDLFEWDEQGVQTRRQLTVPKDMMEEMMIKSDLLNRQLSELQEKLQALRKKDEKNA